MWIGFVKLSSLNILIYDAHLDIAKFNCKTKEFDYAWTMNTSWFILIRNHDELIVKSFFVIFYPNMSQAFHSFNQS
jgi:hypothetical protein